MTYNILHVVRHYMIVKPSGISYRGQCPFHQGNDESFYVFPDRDRWRCFGQCAVGGDADSFKTRIEALLERSRWQLWLS